MNSHTRFITLSVMFTILLSACGQNTTPDNSNQAPGSAVDANVTLTLLVFDSEPTFWPQIKEKFEAKYPNVTLEITEIPEDQYVTKIDTALAAGSPPDIGYFYEPRWVKAGKFLPIDDVITSAKVDFNDLNQGAISTCIYEEKLYCVGSYTGGVLLFYNKAMLDAANLPYPSASEPMTIDEYAEMAAKLTKKSDNPIDTIYGGYAPPPYWWTDWRTNFSEDGRSINGVFNSESNIHMYDVLASMVKDGNAPSSSMLVGANQTIIDTMAQGKAAMAIGDNVLAVPALEGQNISYGVAPVPIAKKGDQPWVSTWTDSYGIFTGNKHVKESKDFLAFLLVEGNKIRSESGGLPLNMKMASELNWADGGNAEGRTTLLTAISLARPNIFVPGFWDVTAPIDEMFQSIIDGQSDAKDAIEQVMPEMNDALARSWGTWDAIK